MAQKIKVDTKNKTKTLKYSVVTKFINFDPSKIGSTVIIVDGVAAIRIRDRVYTKL